MKALGDVSVWDYIEHISRKKKRVQEWMNARMNECKNEWKQEWMNARITSQGLTICHQWISQGAEYVY